MTRPLLLLASVLVAGSTTLAQTTTQTTTKTQTTTTQTENTTSSQTEATQTSVQTTPTPPPCPVGTRLDIALRNPYKIKLAQTISSSTARVSDFVEFTTLEDIYSVKTDVCPARVLLAKGTSVFGVVTLGKHRHFPFVGGKLEVRLVAIKTWDGDKINVEISRYLPPNLHEDEELAKEGRRNSCEELTVNCVRGRRNTVVAPLVPGTATVTGTAVTAVVARELTTKVILATTFLTLASQPNVGELLNGTDAQLSKDDVYNMEIIGPASATVPPPKAP